MNIKRYLRTTGGRLFLFSFGLYLAGTGAMAINGPVESSWLIYCLMFTIVVCGGVYCLGVSTHGSGLSAAGLVLFGPILAPGFIVFTFNATKYGSGPGYALVALGGILVLASLLKGEPAQTESPQEAEAA